MSGLVKLDSAQLDSSIGQLKKGYNVDTLDIMASVASKLKNTGDSNPLIEQALDNCKSFQSQYNMCLEGVDKFLDEMGKVYDIAEYLSKQANIGAVNSRDTSFTTENVDVDAIRI